MRPDHLGIRLRTEDLPSAIFVVGLVTLFGARWLRHGLVRWLTAGPGGFATAETGPMLATIGAITLAIGVAMTGPALSWREAG